MGTVIDHYEIDTGLNENDSKKLKELYKKVQSQLDPDDTLTHNDVYSIHAMFADAWLKGIINRKNTSR